LRGDKPIQIEGETLEEMLSLLSLAVNSKQISLLGRYRDLLSIRMKELNLVGKGESGNLDIHIAESLVPLILSGDRFSSLSEGRFLDLGSGGGFPGVPLAVCCPRCSFLLSDSRQRRVDFLREVVAELGLGNVSVVVGRAEELAHEKAFRESFDVVLTRGVAPFPVVAEMGLPFLKKGGYFVAFKGPLWKKEVSWNPSVLEDLGGALSGVAEYLLPGDRIRYLVFARKERSCSARFPRSAQRLKQETRRFRLLHAKDAEE